MLGSYRKSEVESQQRMTREQIAANAGKSYDQLTPGEISQADETARKQLDQNSTQGKDPTYGDVSGYTQAEVDRSRGMGAAAAKREAYKQNYGDYSNAMGQANAARGSQGDALAMQRAAAMGNQPSRAEILGRSMADQGIQSQMAMAASARGGAMAQAAAMRNAQANQGAYMQQAQTQMAGLRAEEMSNARNAYMQGATGIRGQDLGAAHLGLQRTGMETQNELAQRQLNQQAEQFYERQASNVYEQQLGADSRWSEGEAQRAQQQSQHEDDRLDKYIGAGVGFVGSLLGGLTGLKTGGKFDGSKPLLVGEEGPEIVLPQGPGTVLNAPQTSALLRSGLASDETRKVPVDILGERQKQTEGDLGLDGGALNLDAYMATQPKGDPYAAPTLTAGEKEALSGGKKEKAAGGGLGKSIQDAGRMIASDERAKTPAQEAAYLRGQRDAAQSVMPLHEPEGQRIGIDEHGRGFLASAPSASSGASLSGPAPRYSLAQAAAARQGAAPAAARQLTPDELAAKATEMMAGVKRDEAAALARGPAVKVERDEPPADRMAKTARAMAGAPYKYKPEFTPPTQEPGEVNVGPMAQNMAADPVARTAIKRDPETGLLSIDRDKALKVTMATVAAQQKQLDAMKQKGAR